MTNKLEAAVIRDKLALRFNCVTDCWEVYTTIHGSQLFRWFKISPDTRDWYLKHFPGIQMDSPPVVSNIGTIYDRESSEFKEATYE